MHLYTFDAIAHMAIRMAEHCNPVDCYMMLHDAWLAGVVWC